MVSADISIFPDIRVKSLDWFVSNFSNSEAPEEVSWGRPSRGSRGNRTDRSKPPPKPGYFEIANVEDALEELIAGGGQFIKRVLGFHGNQNDDNNLI